jgi:hypothetical protein
MDELDKNIFIKLADPKFENKITLKLNELKIIPMKI